MALTSQLPEIVAACNRVTRRIDARIDAAQSTQQAFTAQEGYKLTALVALLAFVVAWCLLG